MTAGVPGSRLAKPLDASHEPVTLDIGFVLHADDAAANKRAALYGRPLPRDFPGIDAIWPAAGTPVSRPARP